MHLAAGWSFRHRRTVLIGWPPPYSPAEAGQMNASRTVAFASPAPVAAAQDAPAAAWPPVAGRPRGTARKRRPDPHWPLDREGRGDALLPGGAEKQGLPGNRGCLAPPTPPGAPPGAEAEVDFGDVTVELAGQLARCFLFAFRLSCSGKGVHRVYASQAQEAFLEGHVTAFEAIGGVPFRQVRYDNLSPAVAKVLAGRSRTETTRWLSFRAFCGFEAFYCRPGPEGAHEKPRVAYCTSWE